jgi:hypothetical protein
MKFDGLLAARVRRARAALERRRCGGVLRSNAQTRSRTGALQLTMT